MDQVLRETLLALRSLGPNGSIAYTALLNASASLVRVMSKGHSAEGNLSDSLASEEMGAMSEAFNAAAALESRLETYRDKNMATLALAITRLRIAASENK